MTGIYIIENTVNKKAYVGQSLDIYRRWREHYEEGENATLYGDEFHYQLNQKPQIFSFRILEVCEAKDLNERELYYVNKFNTLSSGYNRVSPTSNKSLKKEVATKSKDFEEKLNDILGKPLFVEDKKKLANFFGYRDKKGNVLGWNTLKKHLIANGFKIIETKRNFNGEQKNCSIISVQYDFAAK